MATSDRFAWDRRQFFGATAALAAGASGGRALGGERPTAPPRATSGDHVEPDWQQRLTVTVGPTKADLVGSTDRVIQAAVDYVARLGGGTVQVLPGTYRLRNSVYLQSQSPAPRQRRRHRSLQGAVRHDASSPPIATGTIRKSPWPTPTGFQVGDGVCLRRKNPHNGAPDVIKRTLVARSGNRFKLDRPLRENFWQMGNADRSACFRIVSGENVSDVSIENLALDGNQGEQRQPRRQLRRLHLPAGLQPHHHPQASPLATTTATASAGRFAMTCSSRTATATTIPGSACIPAPARNGRSCAATSSSGNDIGIFFCWGVKCGLAEKNTIDGNRRRHLDRPSRHGQSDPRQRHPQQRQGRRAVPAGARQGFRRIATASRTIASSTAARITASPSTSRAKPRRSRWLTISLRETRKPQARVGVRIGPHARRPLGGQPHRGVRRARLRSTQAVNNHLFSGGSQSRTRRAALRAAAKQ